MRTPVLLTRALLAVVVAAAGATLSTSVAAASPPTPLITGLTDHARGEALEGGQVTATPGTDLASAVFSLAPGSGTGWRTQPGGSVLAVAKGVLTLHAAKGCTVKEYGPGQAAILPGGRYLVANAGTAPLEFAGAFLKLPVGGANPLTEGTPAPAPAGCAEPAGYSAASTSGASAAAATRGTMVPLAAYGHSLHAHGAAHGIAVDAGKDVMVSSYQIQPGFSTGWVTHVPAIAILTRGTLTYYEAGDGGCVVSERYTPGQAYIHVGGFHMAKNEGPEPVELTVIYFNLPHGGAGAVVPVVGNTLDGYDFVSLPPAECPRLS